MSVGWCARFSNCTRGRPPHGMGIALSPEPGRLTVPADGAPYPAAPRPAPTRREARAPPRPARATITILSRCEPPTTCSNPVSPGMPAQPWIMRLPGCVSCHASIAASHSSPPRAVSEAGTAGKQRRSRVVVGVGRAAVRMIVGQKCAQIVGQPRINRHHPARLGRLRGRSFPAAADCPASPGHVHRARRTQHLRQRQIPDVQPGELTGPQTGERGEHHRQRIDRVTLHPADVVGHGGDLGCGSADGR